MSIGMSADEYWNGDCELVIDYRKAEDLRLEKMDYEAWVYGAYFYEALCDAAPIFRDFVKNGTKPRPYREKPYGINNAKPKTEQQKQQRTNNGRDYMRSFVEKWNKRFLDRQKKGGGINGERGNP